MKITKTASEKTKLNISIREEVKENNMAEESQRETNDRTSKWNNLQLDCKSNEGLVIGLIDSIMTIATIVRKQLNTALSERERAGINEALADLADDRDLKLLIEEATVVNRLIT